MKLTDLSVLILAGGMGTRIKDELGDTPKILATIDKLTFLDYFYKWLNLSLGNIEYDITIASGFGHKILKEFCQNNYPEIKLIKEKKPLGTFGAAVNASKICSSKNILILNGDTIFDVSFSNVLKEYLKERESPLTIVKSTKNNERYGGYKIKANRLVICNQDPSHISLGATFCDKNMLNKFFKIYKNNEDKIYMMDDHFISKASTRPFELQENIKFLDIGTPESFKFSQEFIPRFL